MRQEYTTLRYLGVKRSGVQISPARRAKPRSEAVSRWPGLFAFRPDANQDANAERLKGSRCRSGGSGETPADVLQRSRHDALLEDYIEWLERWSNEPVPRWMSLSVRGVKAPTCCTTSQHAPTASTGLSSSVTSTPKRPAPKRNASWRSCAISSTLSCTSQAAASRPAFDIVNGQMRGVMTTF